jgi:hypothetical protein
MSGYGKADRKRDPERPRHARRTVQTVGSVGLSVLRTTDPFGPVREPLVAFDLATSGLAARRVRGQFVDFPPALNQLQVHEALRNPHLRRVPINDAVRVVYENVLSLRRPIDAAIGRVGLFGKKGKQIHLGFAFTEETEVKLNEERADVIRELEMVAGVSGNVDESFWLPRQHPHITLGILQADTPDYRVRYAINKVKEVLPDSLLLERAKIYTPEH